MLRPLSIRAVERKFNFSDRNKKHFNGCFLVVLTKTHILYYNVSTLAALKVQKAVHSITQTLKEGSVKKFAIAVLAVIFLAAPITPTWAETPQMSKSSVKPSGQICETWQDFNAAKFVEKLAEVKPDSARAAAMLDELLACKGQEVVTISPKPLIENWTKTEGYRFMDHAEGLEKFFPYEIVRGARVRKVNDNCFAILARDRATDQYDIHLLQFSAGESSVKAWNPTVDTVTAMRWGMTETLPEGSPEADQESIENNWQLLQASSAWDGGIGELTGYLKASGFSLRVLSDENVRLLTDLHQSETCVLDSRAFNYYAGLEVMGFDINGWVIMRFANSNLIHAIYLPAPTTKQALSW